MWVLIKLSDEPTGWKLYIHDLISSHFKETVNIRWPPSTLDLEVNDNIPLELENILGHVWQNNLNHYLRFTCWSHQVGRIFAALQQTVNENYQNTY